MTAVWQPYIHPSTCYKTIIFTFTKLCDRLLLTATPHALARQNTLQPYRRLKMARQPAKVLAQVDVRRLLKHVEASRWPCRNSAMVLLSFKAGLRACEIAGLTWDMVLSSNGQLSTSVSVSRHIAKRGTARRIPMHSTLRAELATLHKKYGKPHTGAVIRSERGGTMRPSSVVNWFSKTFAEIDLKGCSSHSGRRTFITRSARLLQRTGGSLKDVQELAGHRSLTTTERYIEGDRAAQRKLVALV
jgi:integrase